MAIKEEYIDLAKDSVPILDVLRELESEYGVDFKIVSKGRTVNLLCPHQVAKPDESEHEDEKVSRTSLSEEKNMIKCWVEGCPVAKGLNNIGLVQLFDDELSFVGAVKKVLEIGGYEFEFEKEEISEERKIELLLTRYVNERCEKLQDGYTMLEENIQPNVRSEVLYLEAAKYLHSRGISKLTAKRLSLGIGGGSSEILDKTSKDMLIKARIISDKHFEYMKNRIIIPNIANKIVTNMTGRDLKVDSDLRYLNIGSVKSLVNIDNAKEHDTIYVFEGGLNGASYIEITEKNNAAFLQGSSTFSREFLTDIILENVINKKDSFKPNTEIVIVGDPDSAGISLVESAGLQMLEAGFNVSVILMPVGESGKKIDLNDILQSLGKTEAKEMWEGLLEKKEPYIIFKIKKEVSLIKEKNKLCYEIKKSKIIEKNLSLNFINPILRWTLEQYLVQIGYPMTSEYFKWVDLNFSKEPKIDGNRLICFVGGIDSDLATNLDESNKCYNVVSLDTRTNIYDIDKSVEIILFTNTSNLLVTKMIYGRLKNEGYMVKVFYSDKPIKSILEYSFALKKSMTFEDLINNI